MKPKAVVSKVERLDLVFAPKPWAFAQERQADIAAHFVALQRRTPKIWNGRILLLHQMEFSGGHFRGAFLETDYAGLMAWQDWGQPQAGIWNCFASAAIVGSDGGWLLGRMGPHTANAGSIYFPCGTPDSSDVADGRVDFEFSVRRELAEETGLSAERFEAEPGWTLVRDGPLVAMVKVMHSREPAAVLRAQIMRHLAGESEPELSDIRVVHGPSDLDPAMPDFVKAFLTQRWQGRRSNLLPNTI